MKIVFDTNILIDFLNNHSEAVKLVSTTKDGCISIITYMELLTGIKDISIRNQVREFLTKFTILNIDEAVSEEVIKLKDVIKMKLPDALVLATAVVNNAVLMTRDLGFKQHPVAQFPYSI